MKDDIIPLSNGTGIRYVRDATPVTWIYPFIDFRDDLS